MQLIKIVLLCFMLLPIAACHSQPRPSDSSVEERMKEFKRLQTELDKRAKTEFLISMSLEDMFEDERVRALAKAAGKGQIKKINKLVEAGVDVNAKGALGATPLFWAFRNIKGFKRLLELGADPNAQYEDGGGIVIWSVEKKNTNFLTLAIQYGGDINKINPHKRTDHETPLMAALIYNEDQSVQILLDAGADVNVVNKLGETAYRLAASQGKFKFLLEMLEMGADYTCRTRRGWPFRYVVASGDWRLQNKKGFDDKLIDKHAPYLPLVKAWLNDRGVDVPSSKEWKRVRDELAASPYEGISGHHSRLLKLGIKQDNKNKRGTEW